MNNLVPIHKFNEAKRLIELSHVVQKIEHDKHNSSKIVFYFNNTKKFLNDWNYIKENIAH